jgi:rfaE bifunctional protein kinase chain/domain
MDFGTLFAQFEQLRVLVVGDVMLDTYLYGSVDRISPEAPVPVVNVSKVERHPGGAANVALNIAAMGARAYIAGVIGHDPDGELLRQALQAYKVRTEGLIIDDSRPTTVKNRVVCRNQQMLRYDMEETRDLAQNQETRLLETISAIIHNENIDVVIFEDYNKGVLTETVIEKTMAICAEALVPTCVDPKSRHFMSYKGATLFKPNLREIKEALKMDIDAGNPDELKQASDNLKEKLQNHITFITLSEKGVFIDEGRTFYNIPAHIRNIADVSGAGDTVIAVAALCLAINLDIRLMAEISNIAGGLVCEAPGVVAINSVQLLAEANRLIK